MTRALPFDTSPWSIGLTGVDDDHLAHRESVFSLSNGNIGWRGLLDEGEPHGIPGSYLAGVFEEHPMPYAEGGYGYPDTGQSVINVPNGQILRLTVDDDPLDVRTGTLRAHEQRLDFRSGTLERNLTWTSPADRTVHVRTRRLVSLRHRAVAAVRYEVEAVDRPVTVTVQSELVANEPLPEPHPDLRVQKILQHPLQTIGAFVLDHAATLVHETRNSRFGVAVAMQHRVATTADAVPEVHTEASDDLARTTVTVRLEPGERLDLLKIVGHAWGRELSAPALRDRAEGAVADVLRGGWDRLADEQRGCLDDYWACADVRIDGEPRLQQAVRFALFSVFQASARAEVRSVPGKGLTGAGYAGHTFWDAEAFVLPVLTATAPDAAREALRWRHATLDHARGRARELHLRGAAFAWRTIDGRESSGYWPASTAAFHLNADIAGAVMRYVRATGDTDFEREAGLEILVETARLWMSLGHHDADGRFHIDGVTGPDEYSAIVDDNVFTNLAARDNLRGAVDAARRHPDIARGFGVDDGEIGGWALTADAVHIPFDHARGVHPQSAGFTDRERWDFAGTGPEEYPLQDHHPYFDLYRKQVLKQADLVLALYFFSDAFTADEKARAFRYYEALTVRDSSLSAAVQAVIAAEVGHLDLAADYLAEAATVDLDDLHDNTEEGLHIASLAGIWTALTAGFGGMRDSPGGLRFAPRLPSQITGMAFGIRVHGRTLRVDVTPDATTYRISAGESLTIQHFGQEVVLAPDTAVTVPTPPLSDPGERPVQPRSREPRDFTQAFATEG
ncbi:glycoside hydrolase family 65 protein [Microbacterium sp.]|uniref:glycoside hydrolase family 65 protein n=1 Tax=Microbacterium sp. TaxID=51671 RepID=UPI003736CF0F